MHHKTKVKRKQEPPIIIAHLTPLNENGGLDLIPKLCKSIFVSFSILTRPYTNQTAYTGKDRKNMKITVQTKCSIRIGSFTILSR